MRSAVRSREAALGQVGRIVCPGCRRDTRKSRVTPAILSSHARVGSMSRQTPWKNSTCVRHCPHYHHRSVLWCVPREDPSRRDRLCVARRRNSPSSRPSLSVCCSFVVSTCPSPCLPATAGVAVHSTALATTSQHARMQGALGRRGFALERAIARICREGGACVSTNVFLRDLEPRSVQWQDGLSLFGWGPAGHRHNFGLCLASRRHRKRRSSQSQWRGHQVGTPT